jgi:Ca2+/Na+ antiporter
MRDLRRTVGVALAVSLLMIFLLGFVATSSRDFVMVLFGFAFGLLAVYLLEYVRSLRSRQKTQS